MNDDLLDPDVLVLWTAVGCWFWLVVMFLNGWLA